MSEYTLDLQIDLNDVEMLMDGKCNLCVLKSIRHGNKDMTGNVVFTSIPWMNLTWIQSLHWDEKCQVYMTEAFQDKAKAKPATSVAPLHHAKLIRFNKDASHTAFDSPPHIMRTRNEWKQDGRIGVQIFNKDIDAFTSIYISSTTALNSVDSIEPVETVTVFFDKDYSNDSIVDNPVTNSFSISYGNKRSATVRYQGGQWTRVD